MSCWPCGDRRRQEDVSEYVMLNGGNVEGTSSSADQVDGRFKTHLEEIKRYTNL